MTKRQANPKTQELFNLALRLRAKKVQLHKVEIAASKIWFGNSPSNQSMRSRLKRLFLAPDEDFANATLAYEAGKHMHEIIALIPKVSRSGASVGNTHGAGKRRKPILPNMNALWKVATEQDKQAFLREHELTYL